MLDSTSLRNLGWQPFFDEQVTIDEIDKFFAARVCAHHGSNILFSTINYELFEDSDVHEFHVPTAIITSHTNCATAQNEIDGIAVGDWFLLQPQSYRAKRRLIRKSQLYRKGAGESGVPQLIASNVDTVFIVSSCNQDFNLSRLERYLALVLESKATPVIVLTKADLYDDPVRLQQQAAGLRPGVIVEFLDARETSQTKILDDWCKFGNTVALLGSSGVGKSTLANAMAGTELATRPIREDDAKGRHTTTARSMHRLSAGGWLIDNPGMRELQLADCASGVADVFSDVVELAAQCKFKNCNHDGDAGCAIAAAVEAGQLDRRRLRNYLKLQSEQARNSSTIAERRLRDRKTGKLYKTIIEEKRNRRREM